jgi:hypothetical protein
MKSADYFIKQLDLNHIPKVVTLMKLTEVMDNKQAALPNNAIDHCFSTSFIFY